MSRDRPTIADDMVLVRATGVAAAELEGETLLYLEATGEVHVLNATATAVFQAFDGTATVAAVVAELADAFAADPDVVAAGARDVAGQLVELGVLVDAADDVRRQPEDPPATETAYRYLRPPSI